MSSSFRLQAAERFKTIASSSEAGSMFRRLKAERRTKATANPFSDQTVTGSRRKPPPSPDGSQPMARAVVCLLGATFLTAVMLQSVLSDRALAGNLGSARLWLRAVTFFG